MCVRLESLPGPCRSRAVSTQKLSAGSIIMSCGPLATVLLSDEKGHRCDYCHIAADSRGTRLQKCTGCVAYFYCSISCQGTHWWQAGHRKVCKRLGKYTASEAFQVLAAHEKMDAVLLSHLLALDSDDAFSSVSELLPGPAEPSPLPVVYSSRLSGPEVLALYARFGNNNFVIHSHLTTFAHGVFPRASRYFNHSCVPNAAAKYILEGGKAPRMEVVALRDIPNGEEVCLPYLDPALIQSRQQIFQLSYGFECRCPSCIFFKNVGPIPDPPTLKSEREGLALQIKQFMKATPCDGLILTTSSFWFPSELLAIFHESFLTDLSETFRNASHDGEYSRAQLSGEALLAVYRLIYPPNYPQIGMHLLEMAKTRWNSLVSRKIDTTEEKAKEECRVYLSEAKAILCVLGAEGDEDGPLVEIRILEDLI